MNIRKDSTSNIKDYPYYFDSSLTKPTYEQVYLTNLAKLTVLQYFSSKNLLRVVSKNISLSRTKKKNRIFNSFSYRKDSVL